MRTPPRRHALATRAGAAASRGADSGAQAGALTRARDGGCGPWTGAGRSVDTSPGRRVRAVDGRESGAGRESGWGEREAGAESGGAGNKTYLL